MVIKSHVLDGRFFVVVHVTMVVEKVAKKKRFRENRQWQKLISKRDEQGFFPFITRLGLSSIFYSLLESEYWYL